MSNFNNTSTKENSHYYDKIKKNKVINDSRLSYYNILQKSKLAKKIITLIRKNILQAAQFWF